MGSPHLPFGFQKHTTSTTGVSACGNNVQSTHGSKSKEPWFYCFFECLHSSSTNILYSYSQSHSGHESYIERPQNERLNEGFTDVDSVHEDNYGQKYGNWKRCRDTRREVVAIYRT